MRYPDQEEFMRLAKPGSMVPVYKEILGDMLTPVMALERFKDEECSFLLESVEEGVLGRYSFLGVDPIAIFRAYQHQVEIQRGAEKEVFYSPDPLKALKELFSHYQPISIPQLPSFYGGCVGYMGYDMVSSFEGIPRGEDDLRAPDLLFLITSSMIIFDHVSNKVQVVTQALIQDDPKKSYEEAGAKISSLLERLKGREGDLPEVVVPQKEVEVESNISSSRFCSMVERAKEYIKAGDIFQVVLSQRLRAPLRVHPFSIYRSLRLINPSPYMFYLNFQDLQLVGSSPEVLVRLEGDRISARPLAGTRKRGETEREDREKALELLKDEKERAEHLMLVDLGRNDLGRVAEYGSVKVSHLMEIEHYSHVMHIVSRIKGSLNGSLDAFDVLKAAFPAGTVSGAPKIRAMEIINELEGVARGPYAGAVGYLSFSGDMDTCIAIRTFVIKDGWVYVQAGAGIVADSKPKEEHQETLNKARALLLALQLAEENWGQV